MSPGFVLLIFFSLNFFSYISSRKESNSEIAQTNKVDFLDEKYSMSKRDAIELMERYKEKRWKRHKRAGFF